jgi:hypothetical protein
VYYPDCDYTDKEFQDELNGPEFGSLNYCNFGFICGCVWGDDRSWKIRYVDLSQVSDKILTISDKFGYFEMPQNLNLKECIDMDSWEPDFQWIALTKMERFRLDK